MSHCCVAPVRQTNPCCWLVIGAVVLLVVCGGNQRGCNNNCSNNSGNNCRNNSKNNCC